MSKKLKFKPYAGSSDGFWRLNLSYREAELVAYLMRHIRFGMDGDAYKDAAFNITTAFDGIEDFEQEILDDLIEMGISVNDSEGTVLEITEKENPYFGALDDGPYNGLEENGCSGCGACTGACHDD